MWRRLDSKSFVIAGDRAPSLELEMIRAHALRAKSTCLDVVHSKLQISRSLSDRTVLKMM